MRAFVTGSTGLLGNNVSRLLIEQGHSVKALARDAAKARQTFTDVPVDVIVGDVCDVSEWAAELAGCDVVFHTAAYFREYFQPGNHRERLERINVKATIDLLTAAEQQGVKKVIYVSSAGVVGVKPSGDPGDESTGPHPIALANLYLKSKLAAEDAILRFVRTHSLPVVLVLPGGMMGPGDAAPTFGGQFVLDYVNGKVPAIPDGGFCVVDARDVAQAMINAVEEGRSGERYIVGGRYVTVGELVKVLEKVTGVAAPRLRVPYAAIVAVAFLAEGFARLTGSKALVSLESVRVMHEKLRWVSDKAIRELGATFRPVEESFRDEVAWYRQHNYI